MHRARRGRIVAPGAGRRGVAEHVARKKAEAYSDVLGPGDILITGDTVVVLHGKVLEKPTDEAHACEMLRALSGQTHTVASAVAVTTLKHGTQSASWTCVMWT